MSFWLFEQVTRRGCGYLIPAGIQGRTGPGQFDLLGGSLAHGRGLELDGLQSPSPFKAFCDEEMQKLHYEKLGSF